MLTFAVGASALAAGFFSGAPVALALALAALIIVAAGRALIDVPRHVVRLETGTGPSLDGLRGALFAEASSGLFVALRLNAPTGQTRRALIFRDELEPDAFRALLAAVRCGS